MNKLLRDLTLGEIQKKCTEKGSDCTGCPFYDNPVCYLNGMPYQWDLIDPHLFTEQEIVDAKTLLRVFPNYDTIMRNLVGEVLLTATGKGYTMLSNSMFPSIRTGERVRLKAICGGEDDGQAD